MKDWDNTLTGKLLIHAENPDSIGYRDNRWYFPDTSGYDKNQIGIGLDRKFTPGLLEAVKLDDKGRTYITEQDEHNLRYQKIKEANDAANRRYKYAQQAVNRPRGTISAVKDAAVVSAIYNLGATYVANTLFEDKDFMLNLFDGTDKQVIDRIHQEYKKKGLNERIRNENKFLGYKQGGKLNYLDYVGRTF